jgi:hypothetical protein
LAAGKLSEVGTGTFKQPKTASAAVYGMSVSSMNIRDCSRGSVLTYAPTPIVDASASDIVFGTGNARLDTMTTYNSVRSREILYLSWEEDLTCS